jgi:hypothetical protein
VRVPVGERCGSGCFSPWHPFRPSRPTKRVAACCEEADVWRRLPRDRPLWRLPHARCSGEVAQVPRQLLRHRVAQAPHPLLRHRGCTGAAPTAAASGLRRRCTNCCGIGIAQAPHQLLRHRGCTCAASTAAASGLHRRRTNRCGADVPHPKRRSTPSVRHHDWPDRPRAGRQWQRGSPRRCRTGPRATWPSSSATTARDGPAPSATWAGAH